MWLILNQIGRRLTESLDPGRRPQKLLLMLDESCSSGPPRFVREPACLHGRLWHSQFPDHSELEPVRTRLWAEPRDLDNRHIRIAVSTMTSAPLARLGCAGDRDRTARHEKLCRVSHKPLAWTLDGEPPRNVPSSPDAWRSHAALIERGDCDGVGPPPAACHQGSLSRGPAISEANLQAPKAATILLSSRPDTGRGTHPLRPRSNCLPLGSESMATRTGGSGASQNCRSTRRSKSRHRSRNMSSMLVP